MLCTHGGWVLVILSTHWVTYGLTQYDSEWVLLQNLWQIAYTTEHSGNYMHINAQSLHTHIRTCNTNRTTAIWEGHHFLSRNTSDWITGYSLWKQKNIIKLEIVTKWKIQQLTRCKHEIFEHRLIDIWMYINVHMAPSHILTLKVDIVDLGIDCVAW